MLTGSVFYLRDFDPHGNGDTRDNFLGERLLLYLFGLLFFSAKKAPVSLVTIRSCGS